VSSVLPLLSSRWDREKKRLTYKIQPSNTSRFVLLNRDELRLLKTQIDRALEGADGNQAASG
jgi:hypothetical protein